MDKIAVLIENLIHDSRRKILEGIYECMDAEGVQVYVFSCHVAPQSVSRALRGAHKIYSLPEFQEFDGVIVVSGTAILEETRETVFAAIARSGVPAVCIDEKRSDMASVIVDSYNGMYELTEHLVRDHGIRSFGYLSGPSASYGFSRRMEAFLDVLKKHGIPMEERCFFEGDFTLESGKRALDYWTEEFGALPGAIVCSNDDMARGLLIELTNRGIQVPEQVVVTGVDNSVVAKGCQPAITTIDREYFQMGREAGAILLKAAQGADIRGEVRKFASRVALGESCGCKEEDALDLGIYKRQHMIKDFHVQEASAVIRGMAIDFSGISGFWEMVEVLKRYVVKVDAQSFYLCMSDMEQVFAARPESEDQEEGVDQRLLWGYTEYMTVPLAYERGKFTSYGAFRKGMILPPNRRCQSKNFHYIIVPLHYLDESFGYCVFGNSDFLADHVLSYNWVQSISSAIQNVRKKHQLHAIIDQLREMGIHDPLTGVYNRAGFFREAEILQARAARERRGVYILFMDIDGLKPVNDTLGHEAGDRYIKGFADILMRVTEREELVMRYGGDEFVIMGVSPGYNRVEELEMDIESAIALENRSGKHEFTMSASMGHESFSADSEIRLEKVLDQADQKMYKEKRRRKQERERQEQERQNEKKAICDL